MGVNSSDALKQAYQNHIQAAQQAMLQHQQHSIYTNQAASVYPKQLSQNDRIEQMLMEVMLQLNLTGKLLDIYK